ncbi:MAG: hypothetical protein KA104_02580 [Candidatus Pacebacteria bacterium]|nr:hypothetical protein [Candidatus Paceibacterota bacterium]
MPSLRTLEGKKAYQEYLAQTPVSGTCPLCEKFALRTFKLWKIVPNAFPYDAIAKEHHMLVPLRHSTEAELTVDEIMELSGIKNHAVDQDYDWIIEAMPKNKSIADHFHLHLIVGK